MYSIFEVRFYIYFTYIIPLVDIFTDAINLIIDAFLATDTTMHVDRN
jgi:hypothetical protein